MAAKRYLVSAGLDDDGYPRPSFVVEVDGPELEVPLREQAQELAKQGEKPEKVAEIMGGKVVTE